MTLESSANGTARNGMVKAVVEIASAAAAAEALGAAISAAADVVEIGVSVTICAT